MRLAIDQLPSRILMQVIKLVRLFLSTTETSKINAMPLMFALR